MGNGCSNNQVFISFRGKDVRFTFLDHLKPKLIECNVNVFTDDNATGEPIQDLLVHIRNSKMAIVIFSKNFAGSRWCMDELVEIKKGIDTGVLKAVIPIFFKVDVESVKKQSGKFGEKFLALQNSLLSEKGISRNEIDSRIQRWKEALVGVTKWIGLSYQKNSSEVDFLKKVVKKVEGVLVKIEAEERRKKSPESSETLQPQQSNPIIQETEEGGVIEFLVDVIFFVNEKRPSMRKLTLLPLLLSGIILKDEDYAIEIDSL